MSNVELYYMPQSPPCRAVLMAARAAGVNLNLKIVNLLAGEHMSPEFLKINPDHTIPTIEDNGLTLWQSRAIMTYFIDQYAKDATAQSLYPKDPKKRAMIDQRLYFNACTLFRYLADYFVPIILNIDPVPDEAKKMKAETHISTLDKILENNAWVAGENMSLADIDIVVTINTAEACGIDIEKYIHVSEWQQKCKREMARFGYDDIETIGANMLAQGFKSRINEIN